MLLVAGVPRSVSCVLISRGDPALRMHFLTRAIITSTTSSNTLTPCSLTGNNCLETWDAGEQRRLGFAGDLDAPGRELQLQVGEKESR